VKKGEDAPTGAIGIHVRAGDRFVDQLTLGSEARFTAKLDEASRIRVIAPKADVGSGADPVVLGVLGNYLLVARTPAELTAIGPYVARTVAVAPAPKEDVALEIPEAALAGPILAGARARWSATRAQLDGAGAPILPVASTVETLLGVIADGKHARLGIDLKPSAVHARFTLTPKPGGGPAEKALGEMATGDLAPLRDLPASAILGMTWRESAAARAAAVPAQAEVLSKLLGKDAAAEDKDAILAALKAEDEARGDWVALGVGLDGTGPNAMVRAPLGDGDRMSKALKGLLDLVKRPSVKATLKESALAITAGKTVIENLPGDAQRVRFERVDDEKKKGDKDPKAVEAPPGSVPSAIDLLYLVTKDTLFGAVGYDPKEALKAIAKAPEGGSLGSTAVMKGALDEVGGDAMFALVVDPIRLVAARAGKSAPPDPSPVVLAVGKSGAPSALWGRLDVAASAIQELVKHRAAF
jgi:hypothetical protein